ncbi:BTB/POZ domain-containing protein KCTD14-like isoform X2 [Mercenaria mercenaria]|uniref:BTB/POZ domain-containing protein KCTD14-like isoform X2 n=1 Tax=Mercenaria mercenaria TaxID=6596 RepID=UPI00234F62EF|nr:BTB/POZ domain-containing protein KCTD14-like isoform X2 [Mercenaria mercenaria]
MDTGMFEDVVELNVGGKLMTTLLNTLRHEPDSMLAAMFSGRHVISKDKDGRYFIDCDGEVFTYIIDYLRFGKLPSQEKAIDVYDLAKYLQIMSLAEKLETYHSVKYRNQIAEPKTQFEDVVELNVDGKLMTTLLKTLRKEPDSMLAAMFSGRQVVSKDKDGRYFVDFDGEVFKFILDYLRFGRLPPQEMALDVFDLAKYLQIVSLAKKLEIFHSVKYRNQIAELRKRVENNGYQKVKEKTINEIKKSNVGPQENKVLNFFSSYGNSCCIPNKDRCKTPGDFTTSINIFIDIESTYLTEDMMALLVHELCKLGFAKYTVTREWNNRCKNCGSDKEFKQIILLTH